MQYVVHVRFAVLYVRCISVLLCFALRLGIRWGAFLQSTTSCAVPVRVCLRLCAAQPCGCFPVAFRCCLQAPSARLVLCCCVAVLLLSVRSFESRRFARLRPTSNWLRQPGEQGNATGTARHTHIITKTPHSKQNKHESQNIYTTTTTLNRRYNKRKSHQTTIPNLLPFVPCLGRSKGVPIVLDPFLFIFNMHETALSLTSNLDITQQYQQMNQQATTIPHPSMHLVDAMKQLPIHTQPIATHVHGTHIAPVHSDSNSIDYAQRKEKTYSTDR